MYANSHFYEYDLKNGTEIENCFTYEKYYRDFIILYFYFITMLSTYTILLLLYCTFNYYYTISWIFYTFLSIIYIVYIFHNLNFL